MNESSFESHICQTLQKNGWVKEELVLTHPTHILGARLAEYLSSLKERDEALKKFSNEELTNLVLTGLTESWDKGVSTATLLNHGLRLKDMSYQLKLLDQDPNKNIFSFKNQYAHDLEQKDRKIDLMLWVNGIPLSPLELKNGQTGQNSRDGVEQLLRRSRDEQCPELFRHSIFCASLDTQNVLLSIANSPQTERDFRPYDPSDGYEPPKDEFNTFHFYGDFLKPSNITELIRDFLYEEEKGNTKTLIFPRFHQWEGVRLVVSLLEESILDDKLGDNFLLQHSAGSGKSKTIAWLCQFLKTLRIPNTEIGIFHKVLVITDRRDLDTQLQRDLLPILGEHSVQRATTKNHLSELLQKDLPAVVSSTVQKFLEFDSNLWPKDKRIAIIIDEAHRSQDGEYNENLRKSLQYVPEDISLEEEIREKISGTNSAIIAFTATPTETTLNKFGCNGKPHHLYSMGQAIREGYILNVAENIITYDTLFQLKQKNGVSIPLLETYPASFINRTLTWAAYESEEIIKEKCDIISAIVRSKTMHAVNGKGRAMVVCISRKAAETYQKVLQESMSDYNISPLVAYTDAQDDIEKMINLNASVGARAKTDEELKTIFKEEDKYRILVVASKFQTGFDEPYLHTLFLDKPVKGVNAVQTLSRLNRCAEGKVDTLVVDFTNSFAEIAKAFRYFLGQAEEISEERFTLDDLHNAFEELCKTTKTTPDDWTPRDGKNPPSEAKLDKTCFELSKKCENKSQVSRLLDILNFFLSKTLLCDNIEWAIRKEVLKGVLGYLSESTGKYSGKELKDTVSAIGLATQLLEIAHQKVSAKTEGKKGAGNKPREVSLAEAIYKINQDNQKKLFTQITALHLLEKGFWGKLDDETSRLLKNLGEAGANETCEKFSSSDSITEILEEQHPEPWELCWDGLYRTVEDNRGPILLEFCRLLQKKAKLSNLEARFYQTQKQTREDLEQAYNHQVEIGEEIEN